MFYRLPTTNFSASAVSLLRPVKPQGDRQALHGEQLGHYQVGGAALSDLPTPRTGAIYLVSLRSTNPPALFACFGYASAAERGWCVRSDEAHLRTGTDPVGKSILGAGELFPTAEPLSKALLTP